MSSIPQVSVKPEVKQSISPVSNVDYKCPRRMYKKCCMMLNFILMLILCYLLYSVMCGQQQRDSSFKLVKRY